MTFRQGDGGRVSWRDITHLMMLSDLPEHNLSIICTGIQGKKKELGNFKTMQKVRISPKNIGMVYVIWFHLTNTFHILTKDFSLQNTVI